MTDFEKIFRDYHGLVFKYLVKLSKNPSLAEELTQETFFRAYMNFSSLKDKEKASAWLCQIAKNSYYAWYNEHKKLEPIESAETETTSQSIEDLITQKDLSKEVLSCLHKLEEPYKEVFMLSVFGGFSLRDISEIFGKSESWARVTFYRAKQKITERMR